MKSFTEFFTTTLPTALADALPDTLRERLPFRPEAMPGWELDHDTTAKPPRKLRAREVEWLIEQLATTQNAGIPLYRSLAMVAQMRAGTPVGEKAYSMQKAMGEGATLSQAFARHAPEAGELSRALIAAGEASGALGSALSSAHALLAARLRLRRKVRMALLYPSVVLTVAFVLVAVLVVKVVPMFEDMYSSAGADLPSVTRFVLALSRLTPVFTVVFAVLAAVVVFVVTRSRDDADLRMRLHRIRLRTPVFGPMLAKAAIARTAATLASLISSGVALLDAIEYAAATSGSAPHHEALLDARQRVADGATFSAALASAGMFPELFVQLAQVGEETGALPEMLAKFSVVAAEELESSAAGMTSLIEPALMVVIGAIVATFLLALYLPLLGIGQALTGG